MKPTIAQVDALGAAALAAMTAAVYVFGARPLLSARAEASRQAATVAAREQEASDMSRRLAGTSARLQRVTQELTDGTLTLEGIEQTNKRVAELTRRATGDRLEINEIKPGAPQSDARFIRVPIRITGSGTFLSCALFMHHLRENFRDTGLAAFDLTGDASSSTDSIRFTFDLIWYTAPAAHASAETTPPG
ncbi:MAG: type 4a pilus biogenesis protein PilO [Phycisphaerales bacterium]|nr:type 4a pilus biogenesis protein PilO [Phycisphaerales bacterium]